jgi:hypothetical protein
VSKIAGELGISEVVPAHLNAQADAGKHGNAARLASAEKAAAFQYRNAQPVGSETRLKPPDHSG